MSPAWHVTTLSHSFTRVISGGQEEEEENKEEEKEKKTEWTSVDLIHSTWIKVGNWWQFDGLNFNPSF